MAKRERRKAMPPSEKTDADKWLDKIERAKKVKDNWRQQFRIDLCYEYWEGRSRPSHIPGEEWISINKIYSNLMAELPTLYSTDPYFYIKLKKSYSPDPQLIAAFEMKARIRQAMLNYLKGELRLKQKARLSIFDSFFQFGIAKVHYYADEVENPDAGKPMLFEDTETPLIDEMGAPILEPDMIPANERYCITRIHPDDFLVDEDAGPLDEDVTWKAQRLKKRIDEVKEDKRYNKAAVQGLKPTELSDPADRAREEKKKGSSFFSETKDAEPDIVVLWEVYDIKNKKRLIVAEGCKEFLVEPEELPPGIERDPFVDLRLTSRDDSWYPLPPVSQWLDSQREYCETRSKMLVHRKRFNRKYEVYTPAFDDGDNAMSKLEAGDDGTCIPKNQPVTAVTPIQDAPLDQQHHMELSYINQDFMDLAVGPNQRGGTAGVDSATEAGILEKRTQLREGDKLGLVADFLNEIAKKLDQLVQAHITRNEAVKISGPQGEAWVDIRTTDYDSISGEYEYSIDAGSTTPQLPEIERAQWQAFLGLIASAPQLALSKRLMTKMAEMHHIYDEAMVDEIINIAQQMVSGAMPMPGQQGSQPGSGEMNPVAMLGGMAEGMNNIRGGNMPQ